MTLYFIAGETSGDTHGAALMAASRALAPSLRFRGRGGPRMKRVADGDFIDWSEFSSVLGLWEVIKQYGYFRQQYRATLDEIRRRPPDAVVLIDYPGFNLRLARALRHKMPTLKIVYYISPQVWAWNRGRIQQMARYLDLMLCIFPFEAELYNQSGLRTIFVGHPMLESLTAQRTATERDPDLVGLFPGSRARELRKILPVMISAAERIAHGRSATRFEIAAASPRLAAQAKEMLRGSSLSPDTVRITSGEAHTLMQRAAAAMVASGTATLEAAFFRLPFVLVYRMAWLTYFAARIVVKVEHVGMPNVLAGREIVPEFIQHRARPQAIAQSVLRLIEDVAGRERMLREFDAIVFALSRQSARTTAAEALLSEVKRQAG